MNKKIKVKILRGCSGSGKTTLRKEWLSKQRYGIISRDELRNALFAQYGNNINNEQEVIITNISHELLQQYIKRRMDIIIDNTNLRAKDVRSYLEIIEYYNKLNDNITIEFIDLTDIPLKKLKEQNNNRDTAIAESEVERQFETSRTNKTFYEDIHRRGEKLNNDINKPPVVIFDLDGTIYLDNQIITDADKVINELKRIGKKIIFISNKTTGTVKDYYKFLKSNGFNINQTDIINSTLILKNYLQKYYSSKTFFAIGEKKFINEIKNSGIIYSEDPQKIDIVIITLDRTLNYQKLEIAANALDNGAKFYAANIDNTCPVEGGEILDAGATISALEHRTNRKLEKHFGKPSKYMLIEALKRIDVNPAKCLIIGDRIETDIAMGNEFNIDTALVSTGVFNDLKHNGKYKPTFKINSVKDLL